MRVLVAGGTGFIGRYLCAELLDRGHRVTAMARSPDASVVPEAVELVEGDVTDYDSIVDAFEGMDAVVNLVALSPLFKPRSGDEQQDRVHRGGTEHCIEAAEKHDVTRFLQLSGHGADPEAPTHHLRAKGRAETLVRNSTLEWTIVRPTVVFGEGDEFVSVMRSLTFPYVAPLPGGGTTPFQPIHVLDLVPMLADCLDDDSHVGKIYEIGGPEVLTMAEVGKRAREARGQSTRVVPVPMALLRVGFRILDVVPLIPFGSDQYRGLKLDSTTDDNDVEAFGVSPAELTTLDEYLGLS